MKKEYQVILKSEATKTFRCEKAANSLDINIEEKLLHEFKVFADVEENFNVGLIFGASGSGKSTLAKSIWGDLIFEEELDSHIPIIDQMNKSLNYEECSNILLGVGLTSVPCWIRPIGTLSNGQKERAKIAFMIAKNENIIVIDEWTSVVDRTVAKVMCFCVQKYARNNNKKIILLSCHEDVFEWLNPDWIINCNEQSYIDRRLLQQTFERKEKFNFEVKECKSTQWKLFSQYHYLSKNLPAFHFCFGLFLGEKQIGINFYSNYVPRVKGKMLILHENRLVLHPDYCGLGLGSKFSNICAEIVKLKGFRVFSKFSNKALLTSRLRDKKWKFCAEHKHLKYSFGNQERKGKGARLKVKTYVFEFIG